MTEPDGVGPEQKLLHLLEQLLDLPALELRDTLDEAATRVAGWLGCEKADAFLVDEARSSLVAGGTSDTPLGRLQQSLGLDVLPLANGGRVAEVFQNRRSHLDGDASRDPQELPGIVQDLGVRSSMAVPLVIGGTTRGVLAVVSQEPHRFDERDLRGLELVARSVGAVAHRAELVDRLRLDEAVRARQLAADDIIAVLAHDLRNHLQPLSVRLQTLKLRLESGRAIASADIDVAIGGVRRLTRMIRDLLDGARLEQGLFELELAPVDLAALVRDTAELLSTPTNAVQVTAPPSLPIIGDAMRLRQALENVVANGIAHSPGGHGVRICVATEGEPERVALEIVDHGPGIAPELLPHIFERFVSTRGSKGLGLGLFLAERIARAHGGLLRVESRLGAGARFLFDLPLEP